MLGGGGDVALIDESGGGVKMSPSSLNVGKEGKLLPHFGR